MQHQKICDLRPKDNVHSIYLVKNITLSEAKDGKKYIILALSDATGELDSRIWQNCDQIIGRINRGDFVSVQGKVNYFQGKRQLVVVEIHSASSNEVDMSDFIMKSIYPPEQMYQELGSIVDQVDDVYLRELLTNILKDEEIKRRLFSWQAGKTIHHAYQSGLLEHILSCTRLAFELSSHYNVNRSYVVAGAILHDLCKIYELTDGLNVEYTEEGKLIGHLVKGLEIVDRFSYRIKNFPYTVKMHLKHILLSHHGELNYGSPKVPLTSEAMLVHLIDLMDSKMNTFATITKLDPTPGHWSQFNKHIERIVFKGELPTYYDYIIEDQELSNHTQNQNIHPNSQVSRVDENVKVAEVQKNVQSPPKKDQSFSNKKTENPQELKQNLGSLLAHLKITDGDREG